MSEPVGAQSASESPSARAILVVLLRGRRLIVLSSLALGFILGLSAILSRPMFRANVSFFAQNAQGDMSGLAGLAGQFGIRVPGVERAPGPAFFHALMYSREILTDVISSSYTITSDDEPRTGSLLDVIEVEAPSEAERMSIGLEWVRRRALTSSVEVEPGIVHFSVLTGWPEVSQELAGSLLDALHTFNNRTRRYQAGAEREFLEGRLDVAQQELESSESELQTFLQQNRLFADSPELLFRHDRLQRQVGMRQQIVTSLAQAFEEARLREVRDTPILTVIEAPILPPRREPRGTVRKTLLGLIFGAGLAMVWLVFVPPRTGELDPDSEELERAWSEAKSDLARFTPFGSSKG